LIYKNYQVFKNFRLIKKGKYRIFFKKISFIITSKTDF
jgi:hypothetical protein